MNLLNSFVSIVTTPIRALYGLVINLTPGSQFLSRLSLAFKWALLSGLFLLIIWIAALVLHILNSNAGRATDSWKQNLIIAFPFIFIIPVFVFYFVRYLMMTEAPRYPEIDHIWNSSVQEAESKGISIANTPLFLVLGVGQLREAKTIVNAMDLGFSVHVPSSGDPPISVHACDAGFFVFLNQCNCISKLSTSSSTTTSNSGAAMGMRPAEVGGTIDANQLEAMEQSYLQPSRSLDASYSPITPGGTMLLDEGVDHTELFKESTVSKQLSSQDKVDCLDRLKYVCSLIKRDRLPLCPINGIVTTIPFDLIETSSGQLQIAIQNDLAVLREELQVRCPNTALVTGMESEDGFIELINRLTPQKAKENRFGKGCDLWAAPEASRLDAVAAHATATFEDWTYMLFQEENALKKKYNSRLFMMLCRIRGTFAENLRAVLSRGFGFDPKIEPHLAFEQFLFGGCYFAATGSGQSHQAFIKSVFDKALQQEGELEWAPAARRSDNFYHFMANIAALLGTAALFSIFAMVAYHYLLAAPPKNLIDQ